MNWTPFILSFKLAFTTAIVLLCVGVPLAFWLSRQRHKWLTIILEALVSLPLVLPPTVIGFYFLVLFSPNSGLGGFLLNRLNLSFVFSFEGLVLASLIYSLPFMVQPLLAGFRGLPKSYYQAAKLMGKTPLNILRRVLLPNMKPALLTGLILSFAHTIGEFGIVLMVGGNIPGETRVASVAIFDFVEMMHYKEAHTYSAILIAMAFAILVFVYAFQRKRSAVVL